MKEIKAQNYEQAEKFISEIPKFTKKNPMDETKGFYEFIQECDKGIYSEEKLGKIIHVAGTNGKGSVCAFLQQIFVESGYHVGMFTSPHLKTMRERFRIDGKIISEEEFTKSFNWLSDKICEYRKIKPEYNPAYFERLFFMGIYIFAKAKADITILETGLGGRLDATNVINHPVLSIITEIGLDHTEYLGDTEEEIAYEKAGIIKQCAPLVYADKKKSVSEIFERKASECGTICYSVSENEYKINEIQKKSIDFSFVSRYYDYGRFIINTTGLYQVENSAIVIRACEVLKNKCGFSRISKESIAAGVSGMRWEGRMEEIRPGVFIDGAHNEDGIKAFVQSLKSAAVLKELGRKDKCIILFSAVSDKKYDKMIEQLCLLDMVTDFVLTRIPGGRGADLDALKKEFEKYTDKNLYAFENIEEAVCYCLDKRGDKGVVYIVGSLYLAGIIKELHGGSYD